MQRGVGNQHGRIDHTPVILNPCIWAKMAFQDAHSRAVDGLGNSVLLRVKDTDHARQEAGQRQPHDDTHNQV